MADSNSRTLEDIRREIESEREQLADAAGSLRASIGRATDIGGKIRSNLPVVAAGAVGVGFLLGGGFRAAARLIFRRGRRD